MAFDPKVIILGAGAAGLSAAAELAHAGLTVLILEARDRLGGRIYTKHDSVCNVPVELGAEFVHGRPPEIWALLRKHNAGMKEIVGEDFCVRDGKLSECDFFSEVDKLLKQMDDRAPDQSFLEFVEHNDQGHETKEWARGYVSGFHAADPGLISVHSLVKGLRADKKIEADRPFRIPQGYAFVIDLFRQELTGRGVSIQLSTCAESIRWARGHVEIGTRNDTGTHTFSAPCVLITLPLGALQASLQASQPESRTLRFVPELPPEKQGALGKLAMGKVIRVTLRFRQRFWEDLRPTHGIGSKTLSEMRFLFSHKNWFPTWWTTMPEKLPIITGWATFKCAEELSGRSENFVMEKALETLARLLNIDKQEIEGLLESGYWHDWQTDPFSFGAYSYVKVGGGRAQRELAMPMENTLFFAGEATDFSGHHGTVHGAIASGRRAAEEILRSAQ